MKRVLFIFIFLMYALVIKLSAQQNINKIKSLTDEILKDPNFLNSSISFCLIDANSGELKSEYNSKTFLIPASTLKVVTTSAALGLLGKDFRYETQVAYRGNFDPASGVLNGDIIIKGSGDPTLNSEFFSATKEKNSLYNWANQLKTFGIKKINGKLIADVSCFDSNLPDNWIWGDIGNYFGTSVCGLSYSDNKIKLYFKTGSKDGDSTFIVKCIPNNPDLNIENHVLTGGNSDNSVSYGTISQNKRTLIGNLPANKNDYEVEISMPDPAWQCLYDFRKILLKEGIKISDQILVSSKNEKIDKVIISHQSVPLSEIIHQTNLHSNNLFAETLLKTVALKKFGFGSLKEGIRWITDFWKQRGLNTDELFMTDGSGLARSNTVTTSFLAKLLSKVYKDKNLYEIINNSFPVAGKNGSLANLCKGTFAENNLRAKSGYINRARGYTGYLKSKSGKELCFAVLFNNYNCSAKEAKLKIEKLLVEFAEF